MYKIIMLSLHALILLTLFTTVSSIKVTIINANLSNPISIEVNRSMEYIIEYTLVQSKFPLRVTAASVNSIQSTPVIVVVRQKKEVLSWQLPMNIDGNDGTKYRSSARTLCYDSTNNNKSLLQGRTDNNFMLEESPIISVSSSSPTNVSVTVSLDEEKKFYIEPNINYTVSLTPSETRFYFYDFPDNATIKDNTKTVLLEVNSNDNICMTISIQNASCPVYDLNHDIKFEGYWQTMNNKGGITISKSKFPYGFFIVFVPKVDDYECSGDLDNNLTTSRNKTISYKITPSISYKDYINAISVTLAAVLFFYIIFGVSFFMCSSRVYIPRSMEYMSESFPNTPVTPLSAPEQMEDNISFDETEYDTIAEDRQDRYIVLTKPVVYLSDLARKDFRILRKKSYSYLWHVLTVALFYGLPVIQLVITYQKVLNDTGNQDLCYYNFICAHPFGFFSDFNHILSNIGYILLGFLFIWIVYRRENWHKDNSFDQHYGIPQHYGMFYAMGVALIMEGFLSGSYHICPNHSNFQFDTSFMYVIAVLSMVNIYQTRHPDINATAYSTFAVLAIAILIGMVGIFEPTVYFWASFTVFHILLGLYLTAHIYYMGCWRLDKPFLYELYQSYINDFRTNPLTAFKPRYINRFVLLLIGNVCNWTLAAFGMYHHDKDFAIYLLAIFMMNTVLYFIFYIIMKLLHKEKINKIALLFLILSLSCAVVAMYCFLNKSISWALTPANSRQFNQECKLMRFYDFHDIWHFLSAIGMFFMFIVLLILDDDISHTHRSKIPVF